MKNDYAWRIATLMVAMLLMAAAVLTSCSGVGGNAGLENNQTSVTNDAERGTGVLTITEDEVGSLPAWQQELLNDPGWNQPTIPQRADTPMPAPSYEMLLQWQEEALANPGVHTPRPELTAGAASKGASYTEYVPLPGVNPPRAGYNLDYSAGGTVPYGCKGTGGTGSPPKMKEGKIFAVGIPTGAGIPISWVNRGASNSNHFNATGGGSNNALASVYQLWCSTRAGNPQKQFEEYNPPADPRPTFAELGYRADGGPAAGGVPCNALQAYTVRDFMWWKYNRTINALPGLTSTALYNILIAPSSNESALGTSLGGTAARWQGFYMGNLGAAYGGAQIVSLESSTSTCTSFASSIPNFRLTYTNPIYGVLLQRWQDSVLKSMIPPNNVPWRGEFGWPVQGPTAYNGGASVLTGNGAYYAWGMYFEKGFFWWIDYINNANVPDEAQAYLFSGSNVFCKQTTDKYERLPTIFYGGATTTPLGVSVIVEASLNPDRGPGSPPAGTFYEVSNPATPLLLDMHAHGYGGAPRTTDGRYKHYTWAFRDGTLGVSNGTAFDDSTKYLQHAYLEQSIYTVRVQIVDNNSVVAYGDSLPIHVGSGGGTGAGQVWLIRMDGGTYETQATALKDSMTALGCTFSEVTFSGTTATDFAADANAKVALFFRGGPANTETNNNTTAMTQAHYDAMRTILNSGSKRKVLFVSQNHATASPTHQGHYYQPYEQDYGSYWYYFPAAKAFGPYTGSFSPVADYTELEEKVEGQTAFPLATYQTGNYYQGIYNYLDTGIYNHYAFASMRSSSYDSPLPRLRLGAYASNAAERYSGAGSSTKIPTQLKVTQSQQWNQRGYWTFSSAPYNVRNPGFIAGIGIEELTTNTQFGDQALVSYGNSTAPGTTAGTGKYWCWGFSFNDITIDSPAGMTKNDLLRNTLAWLDSSLTFSAKTNGGFQEYSGPPQILSVTPAYWTGSEYRTGGQTKPWDGTGSPGGRFPDQTSSNVYRTGAGGFPNDVETTDANNNWINGNDVDFQHPFYAYVHRGVNAVMELGGTGPSWNSTDDSVFYNGLLLSDVDGSWARVNPNIVAGPTTSPSIMLKEDANNTMNRKPVPVVAGYYQSTGVGNTTDDVYANYGTENDSFTAASLTFNNNTALHVETVARWPVGTKYFNWTGPGGLAPNAPDAYLAWQVYPGQGNMIVTGPNAGKFIGINANWNEYLRNFDIDPSFAVSGRANTGWNRPSFTFKDDPSQGRVINFNLRKVKEWNSDFNRDGLISNADKFPVRCRFFVQHQTYWNKVVSASAAGWPNHLANFGGDPAITPPATQNPTVIEGGTYIRDIGTPVYPLQVSDDPTQPDPGATGTLTGQGPGTYTANLRFLIAYGVPNYQIEVDTYYSGGVFAAGPNGNNGQPVPLVTAKTFAQSPNVEGQFNHTINVPANQANGLYTFALRVTDQDTPATVATYVWPTLVNLVPQSLLSENFESGNLNQWTLSGSTHTVGPSYTVTSNNYDWRNLTSAPYANHAAYATNVTYGGTMNPPQGSRMGCWAGPQGDNNTYGPGVSQRYMELTTPVTCVNGQTYTFSCQTNGIAYYEQPGNTYWYGGISPQISWNGGASWETPSAWSGGSSNAQICYSPYPAVWGSTPYAWCSSAQQSGGQWITRTRSFTAVGTSFKIRFGVFTYNMPFQSGATWLPITGPQAIDNIIVQ